MGSEIEKLPNGWTDRHQIWRTYADSSGNEQINSNLFIHSISQTDSGVFTIKTIIFR